MSKSVLIASVTFSPDFALASKKGMLQNQLLLQIFKLLNRNSCFVSGPNK